MIKLQSPGGAIENVDYYANFDATSVKVYENIGRDELVAVIAEAHKRGLKVLG